MAAPTVTWHEVEFNQNGSLKTSLSSLPVLPVENGVSKLNLGAVQAGKATEVHCVVAKFAGTSVQNMKFWLESRTANQPGSQNTNLSRENGWQFFSYIRKRDLTPLNHNYANLTNGQKTGTEVLPTGTNEYFKELPDSEEQASVSDMQVSSVAANDFSPYIYLDVNTPSNALDGLTDGFSYRMSFLYP